MVGTNWMDEWVGRWMGRWIRLKWEKPREELHIHIVFTKLHKLRFLLFLDWAAKWLLRDLAYFSTNTCWQSCMNLWLGHVYLSSWRKYILIHFTWCTCFPSGSHPPFSNYSVLRGFGIYKLHFPDSFISWQKKEPLFLSHILLLLLVFLEVVASRQWSKLLL